MEFNGKVWNLTHTVSKTSKLMVTKFGTGDNVWDPYLCAKFYYDSIRGFCPTVCRAFCNEYKVTRLVNCFGFFLFPRAKPPPPPAPILTINASNDVVLRKDVSFGVSKINFYISTPFSNNNGIFWRIFNGTLEIFDPKSLNNGDAPM